MCKTLEQRLEMQFLIIVFALHNMNSLMATPPTVATDISTQPEIVDTDPKFTNLEGEIN
jgi:hypothetical protein